MTARIDHLTIAAPNLEAGSAYVEAALGIAPGPGREHPGMGTHNRLLALGPSVYLEVIAVDPQAAPPARARWFGLDRIKAGSGSRFAAWVASTDDIDAAVTAEIGIVQTMHRGPHHWKMAVRADGEVPLEGAGPLLIQRPPGADPVAALPPNQLRFEQLTIRHPDPAQTLRLLAAIGLDRSQSVTVLQADRCSLAAQIHTPWGLRSLGDE